MEKLGFDNKLLSLIMLCVSYASFYVLINGEACRNFKPSRGLRQGDLLSPY